MIKNSRPIPDQREERESTYEAPAILASAEFETLALACSRATEFEPVCVGGSYTYS